MPFLAYAIFAERQKCYTAPAEYSKAAQKPRGEESALHGVYYIRRTASDAALTKKLFKSRSKTVGARKMPFLAYMIYAERHLTQILRNFQRLFITVL